MKVRLDITFSKHSTYFLMHYTVSCLLSRSERKTKLKAIFTLLHRCSTYLKSASVLELFQPSFFLEPIPWSLEQFELMIAFLSISNLFYLEQIIA